MSVTVNDLIELLDTQENRYGGATKNPRELNISINGNFCRCIESAKLDGYRDGLITDVTLEIEVPKMKEYYEQEIRDKAISSFADWCYIKGVDFSYMSTSDKSGRQFIDDVIARYCKEQMKEVGDNERA